MGSGRVDSYRFTFLPVVAVAWGVLLVFHPATQGDMYGALRDQVTAWLVVHVGTLVFLGLVGVGFFLLVRDLPGQAARVSRIAIGTFVLFYGAGEAVLGIATGVLVRNANSAPAGERAGAAEAVQALWDDFITGDLLLGVGAVAWILAVLAAAIAFRQAGAPTLVSLLLIPSALVAFHPFPLGPIGLLFLAAAVVVLARSRNAGWRPSTRPGFAA